MKKIIAIIMALTLALSFVVYASAEVEEAPSVDYDKIATDVANRLKDELPDEIDRKIDELMDKWNDTNVEGATFRDRIQAFFTADNIVYTVSMLFMIICAILIMRMKNNQSLLVLSTNRDLNRIEKKFDDFIKNANTEEQIEKVREEIKSNASSAEEAKKASIGVATMLRDIFQNSRTIDEVGKKIMNLDYLKAIGEPVEEEKTEEVKQEV